MKDEGIGIAGWLLADLVLVLAIVFLAFTPAALDDSAAAGATVDAPLILDIGCVEAEQDGRWTPVRCEPDLAGGAVDEYGWEADGGREDSSPGGDYFEARFADVGAVRLTVANEAGEHSAEFLVRPRPASTPTPTATPAATPTATPAPTEAPDCSVRADFRFAQIVLTGAALGTVTWGDIARGRVRDNLIKSEEDERIGDIDEEEWLRTEVEAFLEEKYEKGFRIALVETFSHAPGASPAAGDDVRLSAKVNEALFDELSRRRVDIFVDGETARDNWFADYRDRSDLRSGEVRINLYFVKPPDSEECR